MKNSLSREYTLLKRILGFGKPIELYPLTFLSLMNLSRNGYKLIEFIIEENKKENIPLTRDLNHFSKDKTLNSLRKKELVISPTIIQLSSLLVKYEGNRLDFSLVPQNVREALEKYKGCKGRSLSWRKKFGRSLYYGKWPKCYLALFYDDDSPVYKNCFNSQTILKFKPRKLVL